MDLKQFYAEVKKLVDEKLDMEFEHAYFYQLGVLRGLVNGISNPDPLPKPETKPKPSPSIQYEFAKQQKYEEKKELPYSTRKIAPKGFFAQYVEQIIPALILNRELTAQEIVDYINPKNVNLDSFRAAVNKYLQEILMKSNSSLKKRYEGRKIYYSHIRYGERIQL
jgi:hypothetical protein